MVINLTGQAGAGKTSIAKELVRVMPNAINIDGDEMRDLFKNKDYSEAGRRNNITNAYNIALFLESKKFVPVISLISPYKDLRDDLKSKTQVLEFYIFTSEIRGREKFFAEGYQEPTKDFLLIDTTGVKAEKIAQDILIIVENQILNKIVFGNNENE